MFCDVTDSPTLYDVMMTKAKRSRTGGEYKRTECTGAMFVNAYQESKYYEAEFVFDMCLSRL